jgi:hypothetical protein
MSDAGVRIAAVRRMSRNLVGSVPFRIVLTAWRSVPPMWPLVDGWMIRPIFIAYMLHFARKVQVSSQLGSHQGGWALSRLASQP